MPKLKLTKTAVDTAAPKAKDYELRDTTVPGFLVKVTPVGRKIFMLAYVAANGQRRKPAIGRFGEITVEQARTIAQDWLAGVRRGADPSAERTTARQTPTMKVLCQQFIEGYSVPRNKPSTVETNRSLINAHILPAFGHMKASDVTRSDIAALIDRLKATPATANHVLSCLRKMFNMAEVWGHRPDGSNPCRHVPKYPERGHTRLITDGELQRLYAYLDRAEEEGLEHPFIARAIRLQFEFAARMSEILELKWAWVDLPNRRVVWPDSKTGGMSKPMSEEAVRLLANAPRLADSPFVTPSIFDPSKPMPKDTYYHGWQRVMKRAGLPRAGTHAIRHRAATDIANSGISVKIGMALTAHKTVTMFMRYVHAEDDPIRAAADAVAARRRALVNAASDHAISNSEAGPHSGPAITSNSAHRPSVPPTTGAGCGRQPRTKLGAYRPYRHRNHPRNGADREVSAKPNRPKQTMTEASDA